MRYKGTVSVNVTLHAKITISDLQQYNGNLNLIKRVDCGINYRFFSTRKACISMSFIIASFKKGMRFAQVTFGDNPPMKINNFKKKT